MSEDLSNEVEAINSIFGNGTIEKADCITGDVFVLGLPESPVALRLSFPPTYPEQPPIILGTETTGDTPKKGYGNFVLQKAREALRHTFVAGSVCLFDLIEELAKTAQGQHEHPGETDKEAAPNGTIEYEGRAPVDSPPHFTSPTISWTLSQHVTFKKSVFVARACSVSSPSDAHNAFARLMTIDKRAAKATHNINAYRIRNSPSRGTNSELNEIVYEDCDDDGESAAGSRLLQLLQVMNVWNVFVVVSRWYGGVRLGPDRFRIISQVAREAVMSGGWLKGGGREEHIVQKDKDNTSKRD